MGAFRSPCTGLAAALNLGLTGIPLAMTTAVRTGTSQWIGLRENIQENPIFNGKIDGFL